MIVSLIIIPNFKAYCEHGIHKLSGTSDFCSHPCKLVSDHQTRFLLHLKNEIFRTYRSEKKIQLIFDFFIPQLEHKPDLDVGYLGGNFLALIEAFGLDRDRYNWQNITLI